MRRLGIIGMALVAVIALSSLVASAAFALPEHLPKGSWTGNNDGTTPPQLETLSGAKIECTSAKGTGKENTTDTLGEFTITFEGCKNPATGIKCNSLGDSTGTILTSGEYHYVYDTLSPALGIAILFLPNEVHFECSALVLIRVKSNLATTGGLVCLILEPTSSKVTHLFHCEQSKGDQLEKTYWNDSGTAITDAFLLCSTNSGAFESCGELALAEATFAVANLWENV